MKFISFAFPSTWAMSKSCDSVPMRSSGREYVVRCGVGVASASCRRFALCSITSNKSWERARTGGSQAEGQACGRAGLVDKCRNALGIRVSANVHRATMPSTILIELAGADLECAQRPT